MHARLCVFVCVWFVCKEYEDLSVVRNLGPQDSSFSPVQLAHVAGWFLATCQLEGGKTKTRPPIRISNSIILFIILGGVLGFVFQLLERKRNLADHAVVRKQAVTQFAARLCPERLKVEKRQVLANLGKFYF
jgi:hypothetical protein